MTTQMKYVCQGNMSSSKYKMNHPEIIKVLFIQQLMHEWVVLKNNIKIYLKIYIKTALTCFGAVTLSSGSALIHAYESHSC